MKAKMPNHVSHHVSVNGPRDALQRFMKNHLRTNASGVLHFDFNTLVPMPEGVDRITWCRENWGTKWNSYETTLSVDLEQEHMILCFDTAWSTPEPIFEKLAELFPELTCDITAIDEGWNFWSRSTIQKGDFMAEFFECDETEEDFQRAHLLVHGTRPDDDEDPWK